MLRLYNPRPSRTSRKWTIGILSAHGLALLTLIGLAMIDPEIAVWICDAQQAELAASVPAAVLPQAQLAQSSDIPMQVTRVLYRPYR
jgi:hypothetical protein